MKIIKLVILFLLIGIITLIVVPYIIENRDRYVKENLNGYFSSIISGDKNRKIIFKGEKTGKKLLLTITDDAISTFTTIVNGNLKYDRAVEKDFNAFRFIISNEDNGETVTIRQIIYQPGKNIYLYSDSYLKKPYGYDSPMDFLPVSNGKCCCGSSNDGSNIFYTYFRGHRRIKPYGIQSIKTLRINIQKITGCVNWTIKINDIWEYWNPEYGLVSFKYDNEEQFYRVFDANSTNPRE